MIKKKSTVIDGKIIKNTLGYLHELSERIHGVTCIVEKFIDNPKLSKELYGRYCWLLNDVKEMELSKPEGIIFEEFNPPFNLFSNPCLSESQKNKVYDELEKFRSFVFEIEDKRMKMHKLLGIKYEPQTGISDPELKRFLDSLIDRDKDQKIKVEIIGTPITQTQQYAENLLVKGNKRVTLPSFPRTEWSKVEITFQDDRVVLLSNGIETKPSDFEALGCRDSRNGKPDTNWEFLRKLSKNDGRTLPIGKIERETVKKQKQKITDILRKIFDIDTDPFEIERGGVYVSKFKIKFREPELLKVYSKDQIKLLDLGEAYSEMTESTLEQIDREINEANERI